MHCVKNAIEDGDEFIHVNEYTENDDFVTTKHSIKEIELAILHQSTEFNEQFSADIKLTDSEKDLCEKLMNHSLLKNNIKDAHWIDFVYYD